jgi:preprotein translocase subunit SecA
MPASGRARGQRFRPDAVVLASLTQQRERLLDLVDGIVSAIVEESFPHDKPPEDWDWKGIRSAFIVKKCHGAALEEEGSDDAQA